MTRVIRPIGPVTGALKRHGYRQQAAIVIDGQQLQHTAILSIKVDGKIKFEGHYIDPNGELHKTKTFVDPKRAAARIIGIREQVLADHNRNQAAARKAAPPQRRKRKHSEPATVHSIGAEIMCKGCNTRHPDDEMCPED
jgi:hypothetical protein